MSSQPADGWQRLERELDLWGAQGRQATLWWRDDDASRDCDALRRLLEIATRHRVPVVVAAIPATSDASLAAAIARCDEAAIVQHGFAHLDRAPAGERSAELGNHRPRGERVVELVRGRETLARRFGTRFTPVLVPPWNRIAADVLEDLPGAGFAGLSCFGPRATARPVDGLLQVNAHVDLIAWRRDRSFIGADAAIERLAAHLRARRIGEADAGEPTGVLTHHLAFGGDAFAFLDELMARTCARGASAWLPARSVFAAVAPGDAGA
ncbi:MAG TPA: polysaccharide deacetylase family protein [Casimicrobiaceae bacterium]